MPANLDDIQSRRDKALRAELVDDWGVQHALKKIDKLTSGHGRRTRRSLHTGDHLCHP